MVDVGECGGVGVCGWWCVWVRECVCGGYMCVCVRVCVCGVGVCGCVCVWVCMCVCVCWVCESVVCVSVWSVV